MLMARTASTPPLLLPWMWGPYVRSDCSLRDQRDGVAHAVGLTAVKLTTVQEAAAALAALRSDVLDNAAADEQATAVSLFERVHARLRSELPQDAWYSAGVTVKALENQPLPALRTV